MPFAALAVNTLICWSPFMCPTLGLGGITDESALTRHFWHALVRLLRISPKEINCSRRRFDHGAVRHLDRDLDFGPLDRAACRHQPSRHLGGPLAAVLEHPLAFFSTITVREEHMMALRRPVDAGVPLSLVGHAFSPFEHTSHRDLRRSLYWRSEKRAQVRRGLPTGHRSRPIRRGTCPPQVVGPQGAIGRSRRIGSVPEGYADLGRRPPVTLRSATLHFAPPAACIPRTA